MDEAKTTRIETQAPHCLHTLKNEYPQFTGRYEALLHTQNLRHLMDQRRLKIPKTVAEHHNIKDPAFLARGNASSMDAVVAGWPHPIHQDDIRDLKLRDWQPKSMMVTKETRVEKPAFHVIDIHNHLGGGKGWLTPDRFKRYLAEMDAAGV